MKKLLLIDGMAAVYRGYYALNRSQRVNSKGLDTSAVQGFAMGLLDLLRSQRPSHVGVAFDLQKPTFRHELYASYKAGRDAMPEEIQSNLPWIHRIISCFNIPMLTCEGYEAGDVIGTIANKAVAAGFDKVVMVTPDKDFAQLVTDRIVMYRYGRAGNPDTIMGVGEVLQKFDVSSCSQVIDLLGLWGDSSDNIPGVKGIGEKTAKKLIARFGSVEGVIAHSPEIENERVRRMIEQNADDALFSKQLATIRLDAPVDFDEQELMLKSPDYEQLRQVCNELELRRFALNIFSPKNDFLPQAEKHLPTAVPSPSAAPTLFDSVDVDTTVVEQRPLTAEVLQGLVDRDISLAFDGPRVAVATDADNVWSSAVGDVDCPLLAALLSNRSATILCFDLKNTKYLLEELLTSPLPLPTAKFFDLQLAHYLLDAEMRQTLDFVCRQVLGSEPQGVEAQAAALWQLYPLMAARLKDASLMHLYNDVELPLVDVLISMEREGVRIDTDALRAYSAQLTAEQHDIEQQIYTLAGGQFNISSPRQLGEVLYDKLQITDRPPRTATKQYSTAEEVLTKLADRHPIVPLILNYRSISKLVGTYLDTFPKLISPATGRLHTVYNQTVTATGRLSSSNPNLQNIPIRSDRGREIRRAFVPADKEHLIMAADYSQIELRIIASLAHDRHMIEAFNEGYDIHAATAAKIYHLPIDEVNRDQRRNAKSVNFGIVYGISAFGLAEQLSIPRKEAAALIEEYFAQYPDIAAFIEQCKQFARDHGYAQTLLGRRRYLPDILSRNAAARSFAERNAVNMPIQGTSADMIKLAMVNIYHRMLQEGLQSKMILQVHDELVFDLYKPEQQQLRSMVEEEMKKALPLDGVDIQVGIDIGDNWLEAH